MPPSKKTSLSDEHKAALAEGRNQGRAVRRYLEALEANKPKPGRKRTPDTIQARLHQIEDQIPAASPVERLELTQEKLDLQAALASLDDGIDLAAIEAEFIAAAGPYAQRKGISYAAFRAVGVPAATLRAAGIIRRTDG